MISVMGCLEDYFGKTPENVQAEMRRQICDGLNRLSPLEAEGVYAKLSVPESTIYQLRAGTYRHLTIDEYARFARIEPLNIRTIWGVLGTPNLTETDRETITQQQRKEKWDMGPWPEGITDEEVKEVKMMRYIFEKAFDEIDSSTRKRSAA